VPDVGPVAAGVELGDGVDEILVEDQPRRAAVLEDELQLVGDKTPIEGNHHRPYLGQRKIGLHELRAVHEQETHAFLLLNARLQERIGELVGSFVQLPKRQTQARMAVDVPFTLGRQKRPLRQKKTEIVLHRCLPLRVTHQSARPPAGTHRTASRAHSPEPDRPCEHPGRSLRPGEKIRNKKPGDALDHCLQIRRMRAFFADPLVGSANEIGVARCLSPLPPSP
jgi:hypothetical protein